MGPETFCCIEKCFYVWLLLLLKISLFDIIPSLTLFRLKIAANADSYCVCGFYIFFVKNTVNHKRYETCEKMCFYAVIAVMIYWSCLKFRFHDSEGFFYFPSVMVCPGYFGRVIVKICTYSIKTIVLSFFFNGIYI